MTTVSIIQVCTLIILPLVSYTSNYELLLLVSISLLKTHTSVGISPEPRATRPDARVPLDKVGNGDAVLASDGVAALPALDEVELLAVVDHAGLGGLRRRVRRGRLRGGTAYDAGAEVVSQPHAGAGGSAYTSVPFREVGDRNTGVRGNGAARIARLDQVPAVAVVHHALLDGLRRGVRVIRRRRLRGGPANDAGADVVVDPDARARSATNLSVPGSELGDSDALLGSDGGACVAALHLVEAVAVVHHARLGRLGGRDTVARSGGRWRQV